VVAANRTSLSDELQLCGLVRIDKQDEEIWFGQHTFKASCKIAEQWCQILMLIRECVE